MPLWFTLIYPPIMQVKKPPFWVTFKFDYSGYQIKQFHSICRRMFNINPHEIKAGLLWQRRYCWKYISADNVPGRPHFCTFIARLFAGLLFGWNRIPVEFEFRFPVQSGEWDIGLFFSSRYSQKLRQMVKHIESGKPEHRAIYLWFSSQSHIFWNLVKLCADLQIGQ